MIVFLFYNLFQEVAAHLRILNDASTSNSFSVENLISRQAAFSFLIKNFQV